MRWAGRVTRMSEDTEQLSQWNQMINVRVGPLDRTTNREVTNHGCGSWSLVDERVRRVPRSGVNKARKSGVCSRFNLLNLLSEINTKVTVTICIHQGGFSSFK
uniref:(northern house mosquito) hypothetical protein n=1 Tax=Culex pipiens TaxID=7175 RepID=A0A8D8CH88_CULPI